MKTNNSQFDQGWQSLPQHNRLARTDLGQHAEVMFERAPKCNPVFVRVEIPAFLRF